MNNQIHCRAWSSDQDYKDFTEDEWFDSPFYKLHRTDGPALVYSNGGKAWFQNGQLHRTDGPAQEYSDGTKEWWVNGNRHRTDGPACMNPDGTRTWWINECPLDQEQVETWIQENSIDLTKPEGQMAFKLRFGE